MTEPPHDSFDADYRRAYEQALEAVEAKHAGATTPWQRFRRWSARRLLRRRLHDRKIMRW